MKDSTSSFVLRLLFRVEEELLFSGKCSCLRTADLGVGEPYYFLVSQHVSPPVLVGNVCFTERILLDTHGPVEWGASGRAANIGTIIEF